MPEARDRFRRSHAVSVAFSRRRSGPPGVLVDEPERTLNSFDSPGPRRTPMTNTYANRRRGYRVGRGRFGAPTVGNGRRRIVYSPVGKENTLRRHCRGRETNSVLPFWYPRSPLQDITAVVRAIGRRRARLGEVESQQIQTPLPQGPNFLYYSDHVSNSQLKHNISIFSPHKVPKASLSNGTQIANESEFLTPQKKLLNSIDAVEKVVKEELQELKRTPSAKKADREKRVRTLMSMR